MACACTIPTLTRRIISDLQAEVAKRRTCEPETLHESTGGVYFQAGRIN